MTGRDDAPAGMLATTVRRLLADRCPVETVRASRDRWSSELWDLLERQGLTRAGVAETRGGAGGTLEDAATIVRVCGRSAAPLPIAETSLLAAPLLAAASLDAPPGPLSLSLDASALLRYRRADGEVLVDGTLATVPYGRVASGVAALAVDASGGAPLVVLLDSSRCEVTARTSSAGEPRDSLSCSATPVLLAAPCPEGIDAHWVRRRLTLGRALLIAGAVERVVEMGVAYVQQREQFGRPLSRFQVIQHALVQAMEEVAAAQAAVDVAVGAFVGGDAGLEQTTAAVAKLRAGRAAMRCARAVHQMHGALGVTEEHSLHLFTARLASWRRECGDEGELAMELGRSAIAAGAADLWPSITRTLS